MADAREEPDRRLEVVSTVLLARATVATAWSGYQATRWSGEQTKAYSRANAARLESTRASNLANTQVLVDVTTFAQWVNAYPPSSCSRGTGPSSSPSAASSSRAP